MPLGKASVCKSVSAVPVPGVRRAQCCLATEEGLLSADTPRCGHSPSLAVALPGCPPHTHSLGSVCLHILGTPGLYTTTLIFSTYNPSSLTHPKRAQVALETFPAPLHTSQGSSWRPSAQS